MKIKNFFLTIIFLIGIYLSTTIFTAAFSFIFNKILKQIGLFEQLQGIFPRISMLLFLWLTIWIIFKYWHKLNFNKIILGNYIKKDLFYGTFITLIVIAIFFLIERYFGLIKIIGWKFNEINITRPLILAIVSSLVAAIGEELLFRGYLQKSIEIFYKNKFLAFLISAIIFSLIHIFSLKDGNITIMIFNIFLFGLLFSYMFYKTNSLILPIAFHFMYDLVVEDFFNLSAKTTSDNLYGAITSSNAPSYIIGGQYGIESGIIGFFLVSTLAISFYLYLRIRNKSFS